MIERVISGFQTGADIGGIRAARTYSIPTGGAMPKGFLTEVGPRPDFADYGAVEMPTRDYPARTERNVLDSHVTLWFGDATSPGGKATSLACAKHMRHFVDVTGMTPAQLVVHFGMHEEWRIVNVAGNRESTAPGISERVEGFLGHVFRLLKAESMTRAHREWEERVL